MFVLDGSQAPKLLDCFPWLSLGLHEIVPWPSQFSLASEACVSRQGARCRTQRRQLAKLR